MSQDVNCRKARSSQGRMIPRSCLYPYSSAAFSSKFLNFGWFNHVIGIMYLLRFSPTYTTQWPFGTSFGWPSWPQLHFFPKLEHCLKISWIAIGLIIFVVGNFALIVIVVGDHEEQLLNLKLAREMMLGKDWRIRGAYLWRDLSVNWNKEHVGCGDGAQIKWCFWTQMGLAACPTWLACSRTIGVHLIGPSLSFPLMFYAVSSSRIQF